MNADSVPRAVANGRRVAVALLLLAMTTTVFLLVWSLMLWATRPIVV